MSLSYRRHNPSESKEIDEQFNLFYPEVGDSGWFHYNQFLIVIKKEKKQITDGSFVTVFECIDQHGKSWTSSFRFQLFRTRQDAARFKHNMGIPDYA